MLWYCRQTDYFMAYRCKSTTKLYRKKKQKRKKIIRKRTHEQKNIELNIYTKGLAKNNAKRHQQTPKTQHPSIVFSEHVNIREPTIKSKKKKIFFFIMCIFFSGFVEPASHDHENQHKSKIHQKLDSGKNTRSVKPK